MCCILWDDAPHCQAEWERKAALDSKSRLSCDLIVSCLGVQQRAEIKPTREARRCPFARSWMVSRPRYVAHVAIGRAQVLQSRVCTPHGRRNSNVLRLAPQTARPRISDADRCRGGFCPGHAPSLCLAGFRILVPSRACVVERIVSMYVRPRGLTSSVPASYLLAIRRRQAEDEPSSCSIASQTALWPDKKVVPQLSVFVYVRGLSLIR